MNANEIKLSGKLVNAEGLLKELFSDDCRPSLRWLRTQTKARAIPYLKIGHLVFFDVDLVRAYLAETRLLHGRGWPGSPGCWRGAGQWPLGNSLGRWAIRSRAIVGSRRR